VWPTSTMAWKPLILLSRMNSEDSSVNDSGSHSDLEEVFEFDDFRFEEAEAGAEVDQTDEEKGSLVPKSTSLKLRKRKGLARRTPRDGRKIDDYIEYQDPNIYISSSGMNVKAEPIQCISANHAYINI
jgi:hypothetical protein